MSNLFSGLDALGLGPLENIDVYSSENTNGKAGGDKNVSSASAKPKMVEADVIFDKTFTCPVCDKEFKSKNVKTGKVKLLSADSDLRPKYQLVDSLKYDAVVCPYCGYAALNRFFNYMTGAQAKLIKAQISANFKGISQDGDIYTYDDAIMRHKLALVSTIVKRGKTSEKAYTCLKLAWMYRGKAESLPSDTPDYDKVKKELTDEELDCIKNAYDGFLNAFSKETFPMCGMDENTVTYLAADLARRCGKYEEASRWISKVLTSRDANERIKTKAREIKDLIRLGNKE